MWISLGLFQEDRRKKSTSLDISGRLDVDHSFAGPVGSLTCRVWSEPGGS